MGAPPGRMRTQRGPLGVHSPLDGFPAIPRPASPGIPQGHYDPDSPNPFTEQHFDDNATETS